MEIGSTVGWQAKPTSPTIQPLGAGAANMTFHLQCEYVNSMPRGQRTRTAHKTWPHKLVCRCTAISICVYLCAVEWRFEFHYFVFSIKYINICAMRNIRRCRCQRTVNMSERTLGMGDAIANTISSVNERRHIAHKILIIHWY